MAESHLGQYSLSVISGYQLQAGSSAQEFGAFMKTLEEAGRGTKTLWAHLVRTMYNKLVIAGNISSLGVIIYLVGQLWYNGSKIIQSLKIREFQPTFTAMLRAFCCGVASFVISPKYSQAIRQQEDVEGGCQGSLSEEEDSTTVPILSSYSLNNPDKKVPRGSK